MLLSSQYLRRAHNQRLPWSLSATLRIIPPVPSENISLGTPQVEYRRHQDNLGAASVREERGGGGFPAASPGFGPRGGPPGGAWTRHSRGGGPRGMGDRGDDHHHKVIGTWVRFRGLDAYS